ncbi:MAG: SDR family oxidoreductase [Alphaproteobacteria bacterium]
MTQPIALVTGGTSGIGEAVVARFVAEGYRVLTCGRNPQKVSVLQSKYAGQPVDVLQGDISQQAFRDTLVQALLPYGRLTTLVNNAGVYESSGTFDEDVSAWGNVLNINLVAAHALVQECYPFLKKAQNPSVVNVSSVCGLRALTRCSSTIYSVSKAGLDMLTLRLAQGLGADGIRVNSVNPGVVDTPIWEGAYDKMHEVAKAQHALKGQTIAAEDIANAVFFLASSQAQVITGAIIPVDAGYNLGA